MNIYGREGFGLYLTGLGESANLVVEAIVLSKASLTYEMYRMLCLSLKIYKSMGYNRGVIVTVVVEEG